MRTSAIEYTHTADPLNTDLEMQKEKDTCVETKREVVDTVLDHTGLVTQRMEY